jgi:hypothetical protein
MTHNHSHHHETPIALSFDEKLIKLLEHWIRHNEDHAKTYQDWAVKVKEKNMVKAGSLLEDSAEMTMQINKKFEEAAKLIRDK